MAKKREPSITTPTEGLRQPVDEDSPAGSHAGSLPNVRFVHRKVAVFRRCERLVRPSSNCSTGSSVSAWQTGVTLAREFTKFCEKESLSRLASGPLPAGACPPGGFFDARIRLLTGC